MKNKDIYLDMDGVLFNFDVAFNKIYGLKNFKLSNGYKNFLNNSPYLIIKSWLFVYNNPSFWGNIPCNVSSDFFNKINGNNIYILTALPWFVYFNRDSDIFKIASLFKKKSLEKAKINYLDFYCVYARDKKLFANKNILIDDSIKNCNEWNNAGGESFLFKNEKDFLANFDNKN